MKLRNRQTGKVYTLSDDLYIEYTQGGKIEIRAIIPGGNMSYYYDSLDKLYYEWEDVRPPLIKDKKIRKAVRAWAEVNGVDTSRLRVSKGSNNTAIVGWVKDRVGGLSIDFETRQVEELEDGKKYTIEELYGEEDE
jgi:hypothetical protein